MILKTIRKYDGRAYTNALLELVEERILDKDALIRDLLGWMGEYEVESFCKRNLRDVETNECLIVIEEE